MNTIIRSILILALVLLGLAAIQAANAQTAFTNVTSLEGATNWCAIPYLAYDTGTKKFGGGGVVLYSVVPNFWAGVRAQSLNGQDTTAAVQGQLQATVTWNGIKLTPFVDAATGMGNTELYSSAGTGALISFGQWHISKTATLELGLIGDYEHYVYGSNSGNQINGGPMLHLSF